MESTNVAAPSPSIETASAVPIAELSPDLAAPGSKAVGGVVTITWPYNKVRGTFAFNLAEPSFRLRRDRGQVRVDFTGRAAKAVGDCGLGSNDEVLLSLAGAAWEAETANKRQSLPGANIEWRLVFSDTLHLRIKRVETGEIDYVVVRERPGQRDATPDSALVQPLAVTGSPSPPGRLSPTPIVSPVRGTNATQFGDGEFASPAFVKRARMSYGSLFEDGFNIFEDDGGVVGRGRKRTRFGRDSNAWRYTSQSPSPEPVASSPERVNEQISSPTRVMSPTPEIDVAAAAYQTKERVESSPPPATTTLERQTSPTAPELLSANDVPTHPPEETTAEQSTQTQPLEASFPERIAGLESPKSFVPVFTGVPPPNLGFHPPHSEQPLGSIGYSFAGSPWVEDITPSAFGSHDRRPFLPSHAGEGWVSSDSLGVKISNPHIPLVDPADFSVMHQADGENQEPPDNARIVLAESDSSAFDRPPLETIEDTNPPPIHDNALTDYPTSYLEDLHASQPNQMREQTPQPITVAEPGPNSWTTINHGLKASTAPPTNSLQIMGGDTPEQALVILSESEYDSDSESDLEPTAMEDAVDNGRSYALSRDTEAEDEMDGQYSEDDGPEYDEDEMGGDYDTRNYTQPGDDEDDSHDEDLRPRSLDPEFDGGESWDEEEEREVLDDDDDDEEEEEEEEREYQMDEKMAKPDLQPVVRANPTVIDLISSSEDESEDEEADEEDKRAINSPRLSAHIDSKISPIYQQTVQEDRSQRTSLSDEEPEFLSQAAMSEPDDSSEVKKESDEHINSHGGEKREGENENEKGSEGEDQTSSIGEINQEPDEQNELYMPRPTRNQVDPHAQPRINLGHEVRPDDSPVLDDNQVHEDIPSRQSTLTAEPHSSTAMSAERDVIEKDQPIRPLSAADGLEMLSRAVDEEFSNRTHGLLTEPIVEAGTQTVSDEQFPLEVEEVQTLDSSNQQEILAPEKVPESSPSQNSEQSSDNQITLSKPNTEHQLSTVGNEETTVAAAPSPPLTQTLQSHIGGDDDSIYETTTIDSAVSIAALQLPTPLNTQPTDVTFTAATSISTNLIESFESRATVEQRDFKGQEGSVFEKSMDDLLQENITKDMDADITGQEEYDALTIEAQKQLSSAEPSVISSPTPSFETQVGDEESAMASNIEQTANNSHSPRRPSIGYDSTASDKGNSFMSHMAVDEELQASVLENSQLEDYSDDNMTNEYDEPTPVDSSAASVEPEDATEYEIVPSWLYEHTPAMQIAEEISAQLRRNFVLRSSSAGEGSDTSTPDPSVDLARAANASKKAARKRAASSPLYRPRKRTLDIRRSPTPQTDNSSLRLARASLASQTPMLEEDSYSMTATKLKLARHLRDDLPDYTPVNLLRQHLTKSLDVIGVAMMQPPDPQRAQGGPRQFMMSFTISDHSMGPYGVVEVLLYRPYKDTLPVIRYGDVVLLRNFTAVSLSNKGYGLRTNDESSWAVFDYEGEPAHIRGPPVEYGERESIYVQSLREWFGLLDIRARYKLEEANQKILHAGQSRLEGDSFKDN